jgi:hypothetical protein
MQIPENMTREFITNPNNPTYINATYKPVYQQAPTAPLSFAMAQSPAQIIRDRIIANRVAEQPEVSQVMNPVVKPTRPVKPRITTGSPLQVPIPVASVAPVPRPTTGKSYPSYTRTGFESSQSNIFNQEGDGGSSLFGRQSTVERYPTYTRTGLEGSQSNVLNQESNGGSSLFGRPFQDGGWWENPISYWGSKGISKI